MNESHHKIALVTGAAGFLGSNLCRRLLSRGYWIIGMDNFSTGRLSNLTDLAGHRRFRLVRHDIAQPLRVGNVDDIYNLIHTATPLYDLAQQGKARLFQIATDSSDGNPTHRRLSTPSKTARIFNTYGPYMPPNDGQIVSRFILQALRNQPLTLYGDGSQTYSLCYVDDLLDGFLRLMATPPAVTGPINFGNPTAGTVRELAELVLELTGARARIVHQPLPIDDPVGHCPDITLAQEALGWKPQMPLQQGLCRTIAYFEQMLSTTTTALTRRQETTNTDTTGTTWYSTEQLITVSQ